MIFIGTIWFWFGYPVRVEKHKTFYKCPERRILKEDSTKIRLEGVVTMKTESDTKPWVGQIFELYETSPDAKCAHTLSNEKYAIVQWFYYKEHAPAYCWQDWAAKNCSEHGAKLQLLCDQL